MLTKDIFNHTLPEAKASPGLTYGQFSQAMEDSIQSGCKPNERLKPLLNVLYNGVRLVEWEFTTVNAPAEPAYRIFNSKKTIQITITQKVVEITRGLRRVQVAQGLDAEALFNTLQQAQRIVKPMSDEEMAAYGKEYLDLTAGERKRHVETVNATAEQEAEQIETEEYPLKADPKRPAMDREQTFKLLKSLQGRVLTVVDAVLSDKTQREAAKTLISKEFRHDLNSATKFFATQETLQDPDWYEKIWEEGGKQ